MNLSTNDNDNVHHNSHSSFLLDLDGEVYDISNLAAAAAAPAATAATTTTTSNKIMKSSGTKMPSSTFAVNPHPNHHRHHHHHHQRHPLDAKLTPSLAVTKTAMDIASTGNGSSSSSSSFGVTDLSAKLDRLLQENPNNKNRRKHPPLSSLYPRDAKLMQSIKDIFSHWDSAAPPSTSLETTTTTTIQNKNKNKHDLVREDHLEQSCRSFAQDEDDDECCCRNYNQDSTPAVGRRIGSAGCHGHEGAKTTAAAVRRDSKNAIEQSQRQQQQQQSQRNDQIFGVAPAPAAASVASNQDEQAPSYLNFSLNPDDGCPLMEIGTNIKIPYFGGAKTKAAIAQNQQHVTTCFGCNAKLMCIYGMEYVICASCHVVSPILDYVDSRIQPRGVGIGIVPK